MKILVIIASHELNSSYLENIITLQNYLSIYEKSTIDYCGISNNDDFSNYESAITFKYKIIDANQQLTKICNFIDTYKNELDYDWYIKIRPDIQLLEPILFHKMVDNAINARARVYRGPKKIQYGMSINGEGPHKYVGDCHFNIIENEIVLDDQFYIFNKKCVDAGAFNVFKLNIIEWYDPRNGNYKSQNEWFHTNCWKSRNIPLNVIGINLNFMKINQFSGNINM